MTEPTVMAVKLAWKRAFLSTKGLNRARCSSFCSMICFFCSFCSLRCAHIFHHSTGHKGSCQRRAAAIEAGEIPSTKRKRQQRPRRQVFYFSRSAFSRGARKPLLQDFGAAVVESQNEEYLLLTCLSKSEPNRAMLESFQSYFLAFLKPEMKGKEPVLATSQSTPETRRSTPKHEPKRKSFLTNNTDFLSTFFTLFFGFEKLVLVLAVSVRVPTVHR